MSFGSGWGRCSNHPGYHALAQKEPTRGLSFCVLPSPDQSRQALVGHGKWRLRQWGPFDKSVEFANL